MKPMKRNTHTCICVCTCMYIYIHTYTWSLIFLGKRQKSTNYLYITTGCNALQAPYSNKPYKDINSQFRQFLSFNIFQKGFEISTFNVCGDRQHFIEKLPFIRSSLLCLWVTILVPFHYIFITKELIVTKQLIVGIHFASLVTSLIY